MSHSVQQPPDTDSTLRLTAQEARELGVNSLCRIGFVRDEADIITDHLVNAELCGYSFAGLARILGIAERVKNNKKPEQEISIVRETAASAVVDGGNKVGYLVIHRAAQIAIEKAMKSGFALVGVYNTQMSGRNAHYLEMVARADLVGIHTVASNSNLVAPLGGARAAFGTNPIAFAFPSDRGPVIFDMGTASIMRGDLMLMERLGEKLPEGIALDAEGQPTRDPKEALLGSVFTFGGHKGYGLAFTIQMLGLLSGATAAYHGQIPKALEHQGNYLFIVFDPKLLVPVEEFKKQASELIDRIKSTPRQPGVKEILVPSERAFRDRERRLVEGIVIHRPVYEALKAL